MMLRAVAIFGLLLTLMSARAADLKLEAKLIWGSNDPTNKVQHPMVKDPKLSSHLHRIFKWNNYYEINTKSVSIPQTKTTDLQMSEKCKLEVKNLGANRIDVSCIGKGKPVSRGTHSLSPGQWFVLGGNDKNNSAWFIVMRSTSDTADPTAVGKKN
jgi:hypothetical protein